MVFGALFQNKLGRRKLYRSQVQMTAANGLGWVSYAKSAQYRQQTVFQPPGGQNANNARFAVQHFSRKQQLFKYLAPPRWGDDGRARRGEPTTFDFWCEVQPERGNNETVLKSMRQGDHVEGSLVVHYDPFHPENEKADANGIYVRTSGQRHKVGETGVDMEVNHGFSDVLVYDGLTWKAVKSDLMHGGGDEELHGDYGLIGRAVFVLWEDLQHERHASIDNDTLFSDADIPIS